MGEFSCYQLKRRRNFRTEPIKRKLAEIVTSEPGITLCDAARKLILEFPGRWKSGLRAAQALHCMLRLGTIGVRGASNDRGRMCLWPWTLERGKLEAP
jgi:hypothetical protein